MTPEELRARTKMFAIRIVKLYQALPKTTEAQVLGKQLLRSGTQWRQTTEQLAEAALGQSG